ncbi:MAG: hypothetical protein M9894_32885 [Planctomycetes bacterium]|nr:hypothetical protein [Planctomycetota bacterium]
MTTTRISHGLFAGLVLGLGLALLARPERAAAQQAGGQQMFAVTAPGQGQGANVLYVIEPTTMRLMVYEHRFGQKLELTTVRNLEFDAKYQQWPKDGHPRAPVPSVEQMRKE